MRIYLMIQETMTPLIEKLCSKLDQKVGQMSDALEVFEIMSNKIVSELKNQVCPLSYLLTLFLYSASVGLALTAVIIHVFSRAPRAITFDCEMGVELIDGFCVLNIMFVYCSNVHNFLSNSRYYVNCQFCVNSWHESHSNWKLVKDK